LIIDTIKRNLTNHLFQQNEWLKKDFSKHKSKSILFVVGPIHYAFRVNEDGIPEYKECIDNYDAEIKLSISQKKDWLINSIKKLIPCDLMLIA